MPNWCFVTYKIKGDEKELDALEAILDKMAKRQKPIIDNGFGHLWLGELINELGFNWEDDKYYCRGEIIYYDRDDTFVKIEQETAWCEQEGVRHAIEKRFPSLKVYYQEEEPGCGIYYTNSKEVFPQEYQVEIEIKVDEENCIYDSEYFDSDKELAEYLSSKLKIEMEPNIKNIEEAVDKYLEEHKDDYISIKQFELVNE